MEIVAQPITFCTGLFTYAPMTSFLLMMIIISSSTTESRMPLSLCVQSVSCISELLGTNRMRPAPMAMMIV